MLGDEAVGDVREEGLVQDGMRAKGAKLERDFGNTHVINGPGNAPTLDWPNDSCMIQFDSLCTVCVGARGFWMFGMLKVTTGMVQTSSDLQ
jgi:hypothetical protein